MWQATGRQASERAGRRVGGSLVDGAMNTRFLGAAMVAHTEAMHHACCEATCLRGGYRIMRLMHSSFFCDGSRKIIEIRYDNSCATERSSEYQNQ